MEARTTSISTRSCLSCYRIFWWGARCSGREKGTMAARRAMNASGASPTAVVSSPL